VPVVGQFHSSAWLRACGDNTILVMSVARIGAIGH